MPTDQSLQTLINSPINEYANIIQCVPLFGNPKIAECRYFLLNEIQTKASQTPIEIVLGIDADGKTTAKKLYEFLEMDSTHYGRWYKSNILENPFAIENEDYEVLAIEGENPKGGRPTQDFKLSANFAKKLSMQGKTEKAEQARDYFIKVEDKLKEVATKGISHNVKQLTITSRDIAIMTTSKNLHAKVIANIGDCIIELGQMGFNAKEFLRYSLQLSRKETRLSQSGVHRFCIRK